MNFFEHVVDKAPLFLEATLVTLRLTGMALVFAMLLGAVVAAMSMSRVAPLRWLATTFIGIIRGTPLITQIFVLYFGISEIVKLNAFWAGAIALGVHNAAYIAEIIRSGFQSVPEGLNEASRSLGMSRMQTLRRVRAPLALRAILPVLGSQFIIAVKDSSLVSFIGMTELFQTSKNLAASSYEPLTMYTIVALYYLVIVLALTFLVNWLERRLNKHRRPAAA
ncbi:amino acid ABC transporter permease [Nocardioides sp. Y6]|uniref:Amino acid ABC transporter permease n=1 Tax=Nocardioides malaquae TaxID=2773426 RepID=A0ABR9RQN6_9ACTN|nr:amino acid ABC transporter permease [Nocardioides malaquae]MBE7323872.1 amino acid ABC transporter permease [Nocardioides malaquae]